MEEKNQDGAPLIEHLTELRFRVIRCIFIIMFGFFICFAFSEHIFTWIRGPILPYLPDGGLVFTAPMDKFLAHIKVSMMAGSILTCPLWMYQIWLFVAPGLYEHEKKYGVSFVFFGSLLFITGICFAYFVVFPMAFKYLLGFGGGVDKPMITINEYLSFFVTSILVFGGAFELPLIIVILGLLGIVSPEFLREKRRYAIVALAALSAVITPPDVMSMMMMLLPLCVLYEISIVLVVLLTKKRKAS